MEMDKLLLSAFTFWKTSNLFNLNSRIITIAMLIHLFATCVTSAQVNKGYAPINGLKLYYEIHGAGEIPLVLIHGGGSTIETTFGIILPLLTRHGCVIALE